MPSSVSGVVAAVPGTRCNGLGRLSADTLSLRCREDGPFRLPGASIDSRETMEAEGGWGGGGGGHFSRQASPGQSVRYFFTAQQFMVEPGSINCFCSPVFRRYLCSSRAAFSVVMKRHKASEAQTYTKFTELHCSQSTKYICE